MRLGRDRYCSDGCGTEIDQRIGRAAIDAPASVDVDEEPRRLTPVLSIIPHVPSRVNEADWPIIPPMDWSMFE